MKCYFLNRLLKAGRFFALLAVLIFFSSSLSLSEEMDDSSFVIPVTSAAPDRSEIKIEEGESAAIHIDVKPQNADISDLYWAIDEDIVSVSWKDSILDPVFTGIAGRGYTNARLYDRNGNQLASLEVTVGNPIRSITFAPESIELTVGEETYLNAFPYPSVSYLDDLSWTGDEHVGIAYKDKGSVLHPTVTGLIPGKTRISLNDSNGQYGSWGIDVTVKKPEYKKDYDIILDVPDTIMVNNEGMFSFSLKSLNGISPEAMNLIINSYSWAISNTSLITVNSLDGSYKAIQSGKGSVIANFRTNYGPVTVIKEVTIIPDKDKIAESVSLSNSSITLFRNESGQIFISVTPEDALLSDLFWVMDDEKTAEVKYDKDSILSPQIYARKWGDTVLRLFSAYTGEQLAKVSVYVVSDVEDLILLKNLLTVDISDGTGVIDIFTTPTDAKTLTDFPDYLTWKADNNILDVSASGMNQLRFKMKYPARTGQTDVEVMSADGRFRQTCHITFTDKRVLAKSVKIYDVPEYVFTGKKGILNISVLPENASEYDVEWVSGSKDILEITDGKYQAYKKGRANITVNIKDPLNGDILASSTKSLLVVDAEDLEDKPVPVSTVTLSSNKMTLYPGQTTTLEANILPANASDKAVNWSSSDPETVTVSQAGEIKAMKPGTAEIVVSAQDSGAMDVCTITVKDKDAEQEDPADPKPPIPAVLTIKGLKAVPAGMSTIKLSWENTIGADGYIILRKGKQIAYVLENSFTDSGADPNNFNFYWVIPFHTEDHKVILGKKSDYVWAFGRTIGDIVNVSAEAAGEGIVLKWNKVTGANSYVVLSKSGSSKADFNPPKRTLTNTFTDTGKTGLQFYWVYAVYANDKGQIYAAGKVSPYAWAIAE